MVIIWLACVHQTEFSEGCIMSSCVKPRIKSETNPVVLLHSFDRFVINATNAVIKIILFPAEPGSKYCIT